MADLRLLPESVRDGSTQAITELIDRLGKLDVTALLVYLIDNVTASALPHLAEQFHVTGWEGWALADSDAARRDLIRNAIAIHRKKGTPWAIKQALKAVGYGGVSLIERLPTVYADGSVYADGEVDGSAGLRWALFRARLNLGEDKPFNAVEKAKVLAMIDEYKPASRHLYALDIGADVIEHNPVTDATTPVTGHLSASDCHLPGLRCDGAVIANHGTAWLCNGELLADGTHYPLLGKVTATGITPNNVLDPLSILELHLNNGVDQQRVWLLCDGSIRADGDLLAGGDTPVARDLEMPVHAAHASVDTATCTDVTTPVAVHHAAVDRHLPGLRCDGSVFAHHGAPWLCDGTVLANGDHYPLQGRPIGHTCNSGNGWAVCADGAVIADGSRNPLSGVVYEGSGDRLTFGPLHLNNGSDRQQVWLVCDGTARANGILVAGSDTPVAFDPAMTIRLTRRLRADGRYRASGEIADGSIYATGAITAGTHHIASGEIITHMEAL